MRLALEADQRVAQRWLHGVDWALAGLWQLECVGSVPHDDVAHKPAGPARWDCEGADDAQALTVLAVM